MNENAWETEFRYFSVNVHILASLDDDSLLQQMPFYITNSAHKNGDFVSSKAVCDKKNLFRSENDEWAFV